MKTTGTINLNPNGTKLEAEIEVTYKVNPAEPDVGIMDNYVEIESAVRVYEDGSRGVDEIPFDIDPDDPVFIQVEAIADGARRDDDEDDTPPPTISPVAAERKYDPAKSDLSADTTTIDESCAQCGFPFDTGESIVRDTMTDKAYCSDACAMMRPIRQPTPGEILNIVAGHLEDIGREEERAADLAESVNHDRVANMRRVFADWISLGGPNPFYSGRFSTTEVGFYFDDPVRASWFGWLKSKPVVETTEGSIWRVLC